MRETEGMTDGGREGGRVAERTRGDQWRREVIKKSVTKLREVQDTRDMII